MSLSLCEADVAVGRVSDLRFDNVYSRLPDEFFHRVAPQPLRGARLAHFNSSAAALIQLAPSVAAEPDFIAQLLSEQALPTAAPLAMCYSGHQFGVYVPRLGDGRAIVLGQVRNADAQLWDLQLKGSGPTRYSRGADGRAVLRSSIREYLCSEAMHQLGIPTTRALCLIASDEAVYREQPEPGAMVLRMAQSHVRFGSFEYFYHTGQHAYLRQLADYVIDEFLPQARERVNPYLALFEIVVERTARLIAQWQGVGFAHGVMNSDNMSILGLTLDYGPFGFLDTYQAGFICNHSDHSGRYAFDQQPYIGAFNLTCLAQALLPLIDVDQSAAIEKLQAQIKEYWTVFHQQMADISRAKLGLQTQHEGDQNLWQSLLALMEGGTDYTLAFRALAGFDSSKITQPSALRDMFVDREGFDAWAQRYAARLQQEQSDDGQRAAAMNKVNPKFVLRNYMAEVAIRCAEDNGDFSEIARLMELLQRPFDEQLGNAHYAAPPPAWAQSISVSCSS